MNFCNIFHREYGKDIIEDSFRFWFLRTRSTTRQDLCHPHDNSASVLCESKGSVARRAWEKPSLQQPLPCSGQESLNEKTSQWKRPQSFSNGRLQMTEIADCSRGREQCLFPSLAWQILPTSLSRKKKNVICSTCCWLFILASYTITFANTIANTIIYVRRSRSWKSTVCHGNCKLVVTSSVHRRTTIEQFKCLDLFQK